MISIASLYLRIISNRSYIIQKNLSHQIYRHQYRDTENMRKQTGTMLPKNTQFYRNKF